MTDTAPAPAANQAQIDYWNDLAGQIWVRYQVQLDRQIEPLGLAAMEALAPRPGERILDIGCGCGQTSLALAGRVSPGGVVAGVDISEPMLAVARHRPRPTPGLPVTFQAVDAQTADLGAGGFDAAFSRFGVMFFSDPVAAFANIRGALKPGGRLAFVCWRPLAENPWMAAPLAAARPLLPPPPPPDPLAPGPFAFADADRVCGVLSAAGFSAIDITSFDTLVGGGDLEETMDLSLHVGPLSAALREAPALTGPVGDAVREALRGYQTPRGVMMPAAVWIVRARNVWSADR
jgi:SAM-dependent methyltransferase